MTKTKHDIEVKQDEITIEQFKPEHNVKTFNDGINGEVVYEGVNYTFCGSASLREFGEAIARAFPGYTIWITAGPYRMADVLFLADWPKKIIGFDFYSVNPGFEHLDDIIRELRRGKANYEELERKSGILGE